jgi:hypothetical protein
MMQQIQIKTRPRPRHATPDEPPTVNRKIARIWFPDSQPPTTGKSAS